MVEAHARFELNDLELAVGAVMGPMPGRAPRLPAVAEDPRRVLEQVIMNPLRRSPCVVSFSGGRDSSVILAVATHVARREGLPDPIPVSIDAGADHQPDDQAFRVKVVRHLGLTDWERVAISDELDWIGPIAQESLAMWGVVWPPNAHLLSVPASLAPGGSVLLGAFGDEVFSTSAADLRVQRMVARRRIATARDLIRLGYASAPGAIRRRVFDRRFDPGSSPDWLEPAAALEMRRQIVHDEAVTRPWVVSAFTRFDHLRYTHAIRSTLALSASHHGVTMAAPFGEPRFLSAMARWLSKRPAGRTDILIAMFSDLLNEDILTRQTKADFRFTFFNRYTRAFVERWDGSGCPPGADPLKLRAAWINAADPTVDRYLGNSAVPLQHAFLSENGRAI